MNGSSETGACPLVRPQGRDLRIPAANRRRANRLHVCRRCLPLQQPFGAAAMVFPETSGRETAAGEIEAVTAV